jgi:hypothetical protein
MTATLMRDSHAQDVCDPRRISMRIMLKFTMIIYLQEDMDHAETKAKTIEENMYKKTYKDLWMTQIAITSIHPE